MSLPKILVAYATDKGSTAKLAKAIYSGVHSSGFADGDLFELTDSLTISLTDFDALIFGSPVHMGSMHWRAKKFIDVVCGPLWASQSMSGRFFSVFASGGGFGGAGGGVELSMISMASNFIQLGMNFYPLSRSNECFKFGGSAWGPYLRTNGTNGELIPISDEALQGARLHGCEFAKLTAQYHALRTVPK